MTDFDRVLAHSLQAAGRDWRPSDEIAARRLFVHRRRRRRTVFGAIAVGAAAAVIASAIAVASRDDVHDAAPLPPAGAELHVAQTIPVGTRPSGVAVGFGSVWVTNRTDGTITRVGEDSGELVATIPVGGAPDDIAVGHGSVWVANAARRKVQRISPRSNDLDGESTVTITATSGGQMDLAADDHTVLAAHQAAGRSTIYRIEPETLRPTGLQSVGVRDVALETPGQPWVLGEVNGSSSALDDRVIAIQRPGVDSFDLEHLGESGDPDSPLGEDTDLVVADQGLWAAEGDGRIARFDLNDGEPLVRTTMPEPRIALAAGEGVVWALGSDGNGGELRGLDPITATTIAGPLKLDGDPFDVAVGEGAVWVVDHEANVLQRIEMGAPSQQPSPPAPTSTPERGEVPVFVSASDGEIRAVMPDGTYEQLTDTPEIESHPALSPDGAAVVFERARSHGAAPELIYLDLRTGHECCFRPGSWPAFAPDGELASVLPVGESGPGHIGFGIPTSERQLTGLDAASLAIRDLAWDQTKEVIYYETRATTPGPPVLMQADAVLDPSHMTTDIVGRTPVTVPGTPPGTAFLAPNAMPATSVTVIRVCCDPSGTSYRHAELGQVEVLDSGNRYRKLFDLDDLGMDLTDSDLFVVSLGKWNVESARDGATWARTNRYSWLVGDGLRAWFVGWDGRIVELPYEVTGGASAPIEQELIDNLTGP
jgi:hypothetical protein